MKQGKLILISGPSGVGKDVIYDMVLACPDFQLFKSVSVTTRNPKEQEVDGNDYYFIDYPTLAELVEQRHLLEYQEFLGRHYGTPREPIAFLRSLGKHVLLAVEAQGALQVKHEIPDALSFYLVPKDLQALEAIIRSRGTETDETIRQRINKASLEMKLGNIFQHEVLLEDPKVAADFIIQQIKAALLS